MVSGQGVERNRVGRELHDLKAITPAKKDYPQCIFFNVDGVFFSIVFRYTFLKIYSPWSIALLVLLLFLWKKGACKTLVSLRNLHVCSPFRLGVFCLSSIYQK